MLGLTLAPARVWEVSGLSRTEVVFFPALLTLPVTALLVFLILQLNLILILILISIPTVETFPTARLDQAEPERHAPVLRK